MFNEYALDHVNKFHKPIVLEEKADKLLNEDTVAKTGSIFDHYTDIPLPVWMVVFLIPYLQIFAMLLACTKPNPQFSMAYMWPIYSYLWCQQKLNSRSDSTPEIPVKSTDDKSLKNGSIVIGK